MSHINHSFGLAVRAVVLTMGPSYQLNNGMIRRQDEVGRMTIEVVDTKIRQRRTKSTAETLITNNAKDVKQQPQKVHFSILDILRMAAGFVLLNCFISWWFTGTYNYNYRGKWIHWNFIHYQLMGTPVTLTDSELSLHNGADPSMPIYIALNGTVWDVSMNRKVYGPGGSYHFMSGRDSARAFATNCLNHLTWDIRDLTPEEKRRLSGWVEWFDDKYFRVGEVKHEKLTGVPMSRENCQGKYH